MAVEDAGGRGAEGEASSAAGELGQAHGQEG